MDPLTIAVTGEGIIFSLPQGLHIATMSQSSSFFPDNPGMSSDPTPADQPPDQLVEDSIEESLQPFIAIKPDTTSSVASGKKPEEP